MDNFLTLFRKCNVLENVDIRLNRHFLVPYPQEEGPYKIEVRYPFFLPLEAIEFDENHHYVLSSFVQDERQRRAMNTYLDWLFGSLPQIKELFDVYENLNSEIKKRLKSIGIEFTYKNVFYKLTTIKERLLLSKSIKIDGKYYFLFLDFLKNGEYEYDVKKKSIVFEGVAKGEKLFDYFEKMDVFDFVNEYFLINEIPHAFSIRGVKIGEILVGRRKDVVRKNDKLLPKVEENFYSRVLIGDMNDKYRAFESFLEVSANMNDYFLLKSSNLTLLLELLQFIDRMNENRLRNILKEATLWQLKVIAKGMERCKRE